MGAIRKKLHSRRGASVILALLVMLVVTMICTVILRAAMANAARVRSGEAEEQAYLTVSSAAGVLRGELGALSYRWNDEENPELLVENNAALPLSALVKGMVREIRDGGDESSRTLTIQAEDMDDVTVTLTLSASWSLRGELCLAGSNLRVNNRVVLNAPGTVDTDGGGNTTLRFPGITLGKGGRRG